MGQRHIMERLSVSNFVVSVVYSAVYGVSAA